MHKRAFLAAASLSGLLPATTATAAATRAIGPGLLSLSGDLARTNRGPLDPALDQMMVKHGIAFTKAYQFDADALRRLPAVTIHPTLEYDAKVHALTGPLLDSVLDAAGAPKDEAVQLGLRAVDGYRAPLTRGEARRWRMMVALAIDGGSLALGGLGPQWAVCDADRVVPFKDKPLPERFVLCPWGLYHVDVQAAA